MLNLITNNPYRILGVYANSTKREIVSNRSKSAALLNVGRTLEFPLDFKETGLLPTINRTVDSMADAESRIAIPKEQIKYAQFWFLKSTPLDEVAFNHLLVGDISQAKEIWSKKETLSSLQNTYMCYMLEGSLRPALKTAEKLYEKYGEAFVNEALGITTVQMTGTELLHQFVDAIGDEIGYRQLLDNCAGLSFEDYIKSNAMTPLINSITEEVKNAKQIDHTNASARNQAGHRLIIVAKDSLQQLKKLLPENDPQYQMIADKIGLEILQCGIDFYKNSTNKNQNAVVQAALQFLKYAQSIVVGSIAKQRCDENVDALVKIEKQAAFADDLHAIANELESFHSSSASIERATTLVNNCKPHLNVIKTHLGYSNPDYIAVSSAVANNALGMVIKVVNDAQVPNPYLYTSVHPASLWLTIKKAVTAMTLIETLDMTSEERKHFNDNKTTLLSIKRSLDNTISSYQSSGGGLSSSSTRGGSSSGGCYIATMAYGSYDHPQVMVLRDFRDNYLAERKWGRDFIKFYYKHSPNWVERLKNHKTINRVIRHCLDKFVSFINSHKNY